ncbi:transporter, major facilitator subfamily protein [Pelomyxa schiedti]|nr:transporter, major facilitator subfamily protein [Pelomyxa schiedti]
MLERRHGSRLSFVCWVFLVCSSLAGVQFVYSVQFAVGGPLLHDRLKVSMSSVSLIMGTAGPLSGFFAQPVAGALSDQCWTRWGRRRPFILISSALCACGMLLVALSHDLGMRLGDVEHGLSPSEHVYGLIIAIGGLWVMNIFNNTAHAPARALVSDIIPQEEQQFANSAVSSVMGFSAIFANVVGAQTFSLSNPYRTTFCVGAVAVICLAIPTIIFGKEEVKQKVEPVAGGEEEEKCRRAQLQSSQEARSLISVFTTIPHTIFTLPRNMIVIVLVYFLSWCAFSPFLIYGTSFFGENIYGGGPSKMQLFERGVRMGMYGFALLSAAQWLFSLIQPSIVAKLGPAIVYCSAQAFATLGFVLLAVLPDIVWDLTLQLTFAYIIATIFGINYAVMNSIPFATVKSLTEAQHSAGLIMGVLNAVCVLAQSLVNIVAGQIVHLLHEDLSYALLFGGLFSIAATAGALFMKRSEDPHYLPL